MFKNSDSQKQKLGRNSDISPSTVHNIIKRFKESGGMCEGQGRKPKLNNVLPDPSYGTALRTVIYQ